jgi:uridine kinase
MSSIKPFLLGVAGGSGSGKTYFSRALHARVGSEKSQVIYQDNFYIDQSHRFDHDGGSVNFDHPNSIDFQLLAECLKMLKAGQTTQIPMYDFVTHSRHKKTIEVKPKDLIIVEGILIFHPPEVRDLFDERIFFDTTEELRFQRRLARDIKERGRSPEGVRQQFLNQVKPMHDTYVEPSKAFAHTVSQDLNQFHNTLDRISKKFA